MESRRKRVWRRVRQIWITLGISATGVFRMTAAVLAALEQASAGETQRPTTQERP